MLETLLQKYSDDGISNVESMEILRVDPLNGFGTPLKIISIFGGKKGYQKAIQELEAELYNPAA